MPTLKRSISSRVTIQNPRPRKYATAAERQKALRERFPTLCVRVEQEQADFMKRIADEQGRTLQDVHLAFIKYANGRGNLWLTQGLKGFAPLPRFEEPPKENPMKRKPTPAQIAARERFAEMARSGAFKKKAAKRNPAKKTVSEKISQLSREGYPQKQAVAIALSEERAGKVKRNPITETLIYGLAPGETRAYMEDLLYDGGLKLTQAQIEQVLKAASAAGYHSFRIAGFDPTVKPDFTKALKTGRKRNPRASNPIVLVTDRKPSKRKANPVKRLSLKYACIMPEPGGMAYGIDERTPVTIRFSASELKSAYKCYLIPATVRESAGYQRLISKQKEVYMSLAELKQLFRSFV